MTTKVTVDAHAGWPVEVTTVDTYGDKPPIENKTTVPANTVQEFYVTDSRELHVKEMPRST